MNDRMIVKVPSEEQYRVAVMIGLTAIIKLLAIIAGISQQDTSDRERIAPEYQAFIEDMLR